MKTATATKTAKTAKTAKTKSPEAATTKAKKPEAPAAKMKKPAAVAKPHAPKCAAGCDPKTFGAGKLAQRLCTRLPERVALCYACLAAARNQSVAEAVRDALIDYFCGLGLGEAARAAACAAAAKQAPGIFA